MSTTATHPIGEIARRSGFSTDTLRYYERLGLVPAPERTATGRRAYDSRALERLRFIARAKDVGCTLDEVRDLLAAFDDDCADVAGRLGTLVDGKIGDAQRRVAELIAFTAQLQEARRSLAAASPDGPCGPDCACTGHAGELPAGAAVALSVMDPAIACTLDHGETDGRIREWQAVLDGVTGRSTIDGGVRLDLGSGTDLAEVARLARAEWTCCSFFRFAITIDERGASLEVRAPEDARDLVTAAFGAGA